VTIAIAVLPLPRGHAIAQVAANEPSPGLVTTEIAAGNVHSVSSDHPVDCESRTVLVHRFTARASRTDRFASMCQVSASWGDGI